MVLRIGALETELRRVPLGPPRAASYSWRFQEEELVLRFVPGKSSFAQGASWSPQNDPAASYRARKKVVVTEDCLVPHFSFFYQAMILPAHEKGDLRSDPLLPCCSS